MILTIRNVNVNMIPAHASDVNAPGQFLALASSRREHIQNTVITVPKNAATLIAMVHKNIGIFKLLGG